MIGELARIMTDPRDQLLYSRSARDLISLAREHPDLVADLARTRPVLDFVAEERERLEIELDAERRMLIRANEERLQLFRDAFARWADAWPAVARGIEGLPLAEAHTVVVSRATELLPTRLEGESE